jgi:hypothetical protein
LFGQESEAKLVKAARSGRAVEAAVESAGV